MSRIAATAVSASSRSIALTGGWSIRTTVTPSASSTSIVSYLPQRCLCFLHHCRRVAAGLLALVIGVFGCGQRVFGVPQPSACVVTAHRGGGEIGLQCGQRRVGLGLGALGCGHCRPRLLALVIALVVALGLLGRLLAAGCLACRGENHCRVAELAKAGPSLGLGQPAEPRRDVRVGDRGLQGRRHVVAQRCGRVGQFGFFERGAGHVVDQSALLGGQRADGLAVHRGVGVFQPLTEPGEARPGVLVPERKPVHDPCRRRGFARGRDLFGGVHVAALFGRCGELGAQGCELLGLDLVQLVEFVGHGSHDPLPMPTGRPGQRRDDCEHGGDARDCTLVAHKRRDAQRTSVHSATMCTVSSQQTLRAGIVVGALGVVFGDIGTSPIYTIQTVFNPGDPHPVPISADNVYGVVSTIFWSVMIIVTLTYVMLVMRADNNGEGGIMALITLLRRWTGQRGRRTTMLLAGLGLFGAPLFFRASTITPATSPVPALEGRKVFRRDFEGFIVPITAVIIVGLFSVQRHGTAVVGRFFGPVMIAWFVAIGACGVDGIVDNPEILKALSPTYAVMFLAGHFHIAFFSLAAIVLSVTGAEALYADMGHFGRKSITYGWLGLVLPGLTLSHFGHGAPVLAHESNVSAPFFLLTPEWARIAMVLLATAATVMASQPVITG